MPPTEAQSADGYSNLWDKAAIRPKRLGATMIIAQRILKLKPIFMEVETATGVPWEWIGCILYRESDLNLKGAFCNGDEIIGTGRKTTHVPSGRGPFATWQDSAIDEIKRRGLDKIKSWSVEMFLFQAEAFNGWGYLGKCNSPYVWGWTINYGAPESAGGKYIRDHVFSRAANDTQCGVAAILTELIIISPSTAARFSAATRQLTPPPNVIANETKKATAGNRRATQGGVVAAGAGTVAEGSKHVAQTPVLETPLAITLMAIGAIIVIVAGALTIKTGNLLKARW